MVEKLVGKSFIPVEGLKAIKRGDIFRTVDNGMEGPVLVAAADAKEVPHPRIEGRTVWHVKTG